VGRTSRSPSLMFHRQKVVGIFVSRDGGTCCLAFRREKSVPRAAVRCRGRHGCDVIFVPPSTTNHSSISASTPSQAERGVHGECLQQTGAEGKSLEEIPGRNCGAAKHRRERLYDFSTHGRRDPSPSRAGGPRRKGNARFASTHQSAHRSPSRQAANKKRLLLELKLLADARPGRLPPNAGKSTLHLRISARAPQ